MCLCCLLLTIAVLPGFVLACCCNDLVELLWDWTKVFSINILINILALLSVCPVSSSLNWFIFIPLASLTSLSFPDSYVWLHPNSWCGQWKTFCPRGEMWPSAFKNSSLELFQVHWVSSPKPAPQKAWWEGGRRSFQVFLRRAGSPKPTWKEMAAAQAATSAREADGRELPESCRIQGRPGATWSS